MQIHGIDDSGERFGPVTLEINAKATRHLNSDNLESGNDDKGLSQGLGDGDGNWRLELETTLDIEPLAYIRTEDGFVTSMHDLVARGAPRCHHVPFFNPGSNEAQVSLLRLINKSDTENEVTLLGLDDEGDRADGAVFLTLPAGGVHTISAQELESGASDLTGAFGDGVGKWHLFVSSEHPVELVNMLRSPTGHLTNLSTSTTDRNCDRTDLVTPEIERAALVALYNATDGTNWAQSENWLSGRPVGEWYGVTTEADGRVTGLELSNNELSGEIPPELGKLANLTSLSLAYNALSGEIPPEVGKLVNLTSLDLSWNRLSGSIPSELVNLHKLSVLYLAGNQIHYVSPELVTSPPPTWRFAGDISEEHQRVLREEMEYVRAYFSHRFGIEATAFTVLVGADFEALSPVYRDVVGDDLAGYYHPQAKYLYAWVSSSATGGAVMTLMFGTLTDDPLSSLKHHIAHEYFHVLQGQLASGFAQLEGGETAWHNDTSSRGPNWLVEGLAAYADHAYTPNRAGRSPFLYRYSPYADLTWFHLNGTVDIGDLARLEDYQTFVCTFSDNYAYPLSFAASAFLARQSEKDAYVDYWKLVGERPTWQQAFEEAFGTEVNDFYNAFNRWLPSQLLPPCPAQAANALARHGEPASDLEIPLSRHPHRPRPRPLPRSLRRQGMGQLGNPTESPQYRLDRPGRPAFVHDRHVRRGCRRDRVSVPGVV